MTPELAWLLRIVVFVGGLVVMSMRSSEFGDNTISDFAAPLGDVSATVTQ